MIKNELKKSVILIIPAKGIWHETNLFQYWQIVLIYFSLFHSSRGSLKADVKVLAIINSKTDTKAEAINHLIDGIHDALGEQLTDIFLLGRRLINIFKNRISTLFI